MENSISSIVNIIFIIIGWVLFFGTGIKLIRNNLKVSSEKTIRAVLADKQHFHEQIMRKIEPLSEEKERFVLIFNSLDGKKHLFVVTELTFLSYNIGDRGKLTYSGTKFVDFK